MGVATTQQLKIQALSQFLSQDIVCRLVVKPTSSILHNVRSIDRFGNEVELRTKGRHDPCVGIRATPVAEAMLAVVLADHLLRHRAQCG